MAEKKEYIFVSKPLAIGLGELAISLELNKRFIVSDPLAINRVFLIQENIIYLLLICQLLKCGYVYHNHHFFELLAIKKQIRQLRVRGYSFKLPPVSFDK